MRKSLTDSPPWKEAIKASADPLRATRFLDQLSAGKRDELARATPERARILAALFSGSVAVSETLIKNPDWLDLLAPDFLRHARREQGLRREVEEIGRASCRERV